MTSIKLGRNKYGKSEVKLFTVQRSNGMHKVRDWEVEPLVAGPFEAMYLDGDNALCLTTDTVRGTVFALAKKNPRETPEEFAIMLAAHFIDTVPQVDQCQVTIKVNQWRRAGVRGEESDHGFVGVSSGRAFTRVLKTGDELPTILSGISGLPVLKTTGSAFDNYFENEYTTGPPPTRDRIMASLVDATWHYSEIDVEFERVASRVQDLLIETFTVHDESESVQHTLWEMGQAVLKEISSIDQITIRMPNRHHIPVDLSPYGLENDNEVYVVTDNPYGLIEATIERSGIQAPQMGWTTMEL